MVGGHTPSLFYVHLDEHRAEIIIYNAYHIATKINHWLDGGGGGFFEESVKVDDGQFPRVWLI